MKNIVQGTLNSLAGYNSQKEMTAEGVSELEERFIDIIQ